MSTRTKSLCSYIFPAMGGLFVPIFTMWLTVFLLDKALVQPH